MTKDKARKQAARMRAAETGERYVVARRRIDERPIAATPEPALERDLGVLHRWTHRVPGVPEHTATRPRNSAHRPHRSRSLQSGRRPNRGEPRVLIGWQHRIARLFRAE